MEEKKQTSIESILPLKEIQEAMLLHHVYNKHDSGFLLVQFEIKGQIDTSKFEKAWNLVIKRHGVLRSSVHWENIKKPIQLVHKIGTPNFQFLDWSNFSPDQQEKELTSLKSSINEHGIDFKKFPLLNFYLIDLDVQNHIFLWPSHHLLVDGWSTSNMIEDVLNIYDSYSNEKEPSLTELPSLKSYFGWIKNKNSAESHSFWTNYFDGYGKSELFGSNSHKGIESREVSKKVVLSVQETKGLANRAKNAQVSLSTLIQGAWALLVGAYFEMEDVVFGNAVSGRSNDFPNIDVLAGMFMNVQPQRISFEKTTIISQWLKEIQIRQISALPFEHISETQITQIIGRPEEKSLFDSLLIFENYPWNNKKRGNLEVSEFKSGITTNYPITLAVAPDKQMQFEFILKNSMAHEQSVKWILESWQVILESLANEELKQVNDIINTIKPYAIDQIIEASKYSDNNFDFVAPKNEVQLKLVRIWETLFEKEGIGVTDDYFELGGSSLMAIKMFALIESKMGVKLPPTTLLFATTIEQISEKLLETKNEDLANWEFLVPLKTHGKSTPLFCVHGGEGHVLFYKLLPKYVGAERPIYLLQPKGINGDAPMHTSIEEMSKDYLSEMLKIQTDGPYNIMFFCYSALAVELASLIEKRGQKVNLIIVDSFAKSPIKKAKPRIITRLNNYMLKLCLAPLMTLKNSVDFRYRQFIEPIYMMLTKDQTTISLVKIRKQLDQVHYEYNWKKVNSQCTLIIAKQELAALKEEKIQQWQHWSNTKIKVFYNSGNHLNLFEEPHIRSLAKNVEMTCNVSDE